MLTIYNTLAREKQQFRPIAAPKVGIYVCGVTVYDYCHIGHARMMLAFDVIVRWLRASGYAVTYVRNITDIDDKIIKRSVENGESIASLTGRFTKAMHEDLARLGIAPPDLEPLATAYVPEMLGLIEILKDKGLAYVSKDGDVNFAVHDFPGYGKLSGKSLEQLRAGERVAIDVEKRDPLDFALWKSTKPGEPLDAQWDSPWGRGRPGWHIECSAMAQTLLGQPFDIHGGGADLQFPHHENEIAQSEGAAGKPLANYWLHNGFVNVDNEKMSKSLSNFFTIREVLKEFDAEVVRFFLLRSHYRSAINYSDHTLADARGALTRLYTTLRDTAADDEPLDWDETHAARFRVAMDDDFNTAIATSILFELANETNRSHSRVDARQLRHLGGLLGLLERDPIAFLQTESGHAGAVDESMIKSAIASRTAAKKSRDFAEADRIRAELLAGGIVLEDSAEGTSWRRV